MISSGGCSSLPGAEVREASSAADYGAVAALMRAFVAWHYERHSDDRHIIDSYFDPVAFEAEMKELPGCFAPPRGAHSLSQKRMDASPAASRCESRGSARAK